MVSRFRLLADERGSSALEFVLVLPAVLLLVFAIYNLCFLVYAASSLHWAVEQSARCSAMSQRNTGLSCTTRTAAQTYAGSIYSGPRISPSFTATEDTTNANTPCRRVAGSGSYRIVTGYLNISVPISASSCYPEANTGIAWSI